MRVLSAMQPSGTLHLGNYFGSMLPNLQMANSAEESLFFVVDLHALTTVHDAEKLRQSRWDAVYDYLAAGFNPETTTIFFQGDVPQHTELMWILSTLCPMGLLERAVSFKDKVAKGLEASVGLFNYPVLMAADILLYDINVVPVGKDQKQHVEMTRDLAIKFNNQFGEESLVVPEPKIAESVAVVPGTDGQKMSKSYGNTIPLFGDEKEIKKAIMSIETDSKDKDDPKEPETCSIYLIHKLFLSDSEAATLADEYRNGIPYGEAKKRLLATYMDYFGPMRETRASLTEEHVTDVMREGAKKASTIAEATMERVRTATGLR